MSSFVINKDNMEKYIPVENGKVNTSIYKYVYYLKSYMYIFKIDKKDVGKKEDELKKIMLRILNLIDANKEQFNGTTALSNITVDNSYKGGVSGKINCQSWDDSFAFVTLKCLQESNTELSSLNPPNIKLYSEGIIFFLYLLRTLYFKYTFQKPITGNSLSLMKIIANNYKTRKQTANNFSEDMFINFVENLRL